MLIKVSCQQAMVIRFGGVKVLIGFFTLLMKVYHGASYVSALQVFCSCVLVQYRLSPSVWISCQEAVQHT